MLTFFVNDLEELRFFEHMKEAMILTYHFEREPKPDEEVFIFVKGTIGEVPLYTGFVWQHDKGPFIDDETDAIEIWLSKDHIWQEKDPDNV